MASRRPIVVLDSGLRGELPSGDTVVSAGVIPFVLAAGTDANIALTTSEEIPFLLADGTPADIPLVAS